MGWNLYRLPEQPLYSAHPLTGWTLSNSLWELLSDTAMGSKDSELRPRPLDIRTLARGVRFLSGVDPDLARINAELGLPPMWARKPGFPTLLYIILEQQVSLSSAKATFRRLRQAVQNVTPKNFLGLNDHELKQIGFSRQKTAYCRELALSIVNKDIDLDAVKSLDDRSARLALMELRGVGPWTADIYLLTALLRPDIWPAGDLALATAIQELKGLPSRPTVEEVDRIALSWRPWRAVAARLLWHCYLSSRNNAAR
jgi:DNA-3-methyladenine glycosylase II